MIGAVHDIIYYYFLFLKALFKNPCGNLSNILDAWFINGSNCPASCFNWSCRAFKSFAVEVNPSNVLLFIMGAAWFCNSAGFVWGSGTGSVFIFLGVNGGLLDLSFYFLNLHVINCLL